MAFTVFVPVTVMANSFNQIHVIPETRYRIVRMYHWVSRGETLESIAELWGTNVPLIRELNWPYFHDLELRNQTMGLNIRLEPGVRLHMYDIFTARYYVRRGDTLERMAGGSSLLPFGNAFGLSTTPARIINENHYWFQQLRMVNETYEWNSPLVESFFMFPRIGDRHTLWNEDFLLNVGVNARPNDASFPYMALGPLTAAPGVVCGEAPYLASHSVGGAPLFISFPVVATQVMSSCYGWFIHCYHLMFYYYGLEHERPFGQYYETSHMPWPTNPMLVRPEENWHWPIGMSSYHVGDNVGYFALRPLNIPAMQAIWTSR